jgi:hypothetical protein
MRTVFRGASRKADDLGLIIGLRRTLGCVTVAYEAIRSRPAGISTGLKRVFVYCNTIQALC